MQRQASRRALGITAIVVAALMTIAMVATVSGRPPGHNPNGGGGQPALLSDGSSRLG